MEPQSPESTEKTPSQVAAAQPAVKTYAQLTPENVPGYLQKHGGEKYLSTNPSAWKAVEIGDGNLNFIFHVKAGEGDGHEVCVKQAPPFIKVVPGFPLPQQRIGCEADYLLEATRRIPGSVPKVLIWNEQTAKNGVMVMEWLPQMQVLRHLMSQSADNVQKMKDFVGAKIGSYLAKMTFFTSELCLSSSEKKEYMSRYANRNTKKSGTGWEGGGRCGNWFVCVCVCVCVCVVVMGGGVVR